MKSNLKRTQNNMICIDFPNYSEYSNTVYLNTTYLQGN